MRILNIHGFDGSSANTNCKLILSSYNEVVSLELDYRNKTLSKIYDQLRNVMITTRIDLIVATSFGSFFAKRLAEEFGKHCIFINPCFRPDISLKAIAPEYFTEDHTVEVNEWIEDYKQYSFKDDIIIVGTDDEIIDHNVITRQIAKDATFYIVQGGKHQLKADEYKLLFNNALITGGTKI